MSLRITAVRATTAPAAAERSGLLAWVSCTVGDQLRLDGLAVRRTREGRVIVSFPSRRDRDGREHAYIRPLGESVRREIERQILRALDLEQEATS